MPPREPPKPRVPRPSSATGYRLSSSSIDSAWDDEPDTAVKALREQVKRNELLEAQLALARADHSSQAPQRVDSEAPRARVSADVSLGKGRWWKVVITAIGLAGGGSILGFTIHATKKDSPGDKPTEAKSTEVTTTTVLIPLQIQTKLDDLATKNQQLRNCIDAWRKSFAEQDDLEREAFLQAGIDILRREEAEEERRINVDPPIRRNLIGVDLSPKNRVKITYQRKPFPKCP